MNSRTTFSETSSQLDGHSEHITAIIGKNGTGKSHLLTSIVQAFIRLEELQKKKKQPSSKATLQHLSYSVDGKRCSIQFLEKNELHIEIDGERAELEILPLPRRVVALTISPFDKFPVPRSLRHSIAPAEPSIYQYLGLRDSFNKASIETLLFRSLANLFEEKENEAIRRINIGSIFEYLNLKPTLTVIYRLRIPIDIRATLSDFEVDTNGESPFLAALQQDFRFRRAKEQLDSGLDEAELKDLLKSAINLSNKNIVRVTADFAAGGEIDETFRLLQPLRRAGFLSLSGVEVTQSNGLVSDLKRASSGQLSMVSALLSLASVITNGSLVLIDEPELSLHPEWQVDYVGLLIKTFARFQGCHFVIATHSPMVVSELPLHAKVIALDRSDLPPLEQILGQSADYLLAELFGAPGPNNLYVRERIAEALRAIATGQAKTQEFRAILSDLYKIGAELSPDDPALEIITSIKKIGQDAGTEVDS